MSISRQLRFGGPACTLTGCEDRVAQQTPMGFNDVPPEVMKVAKENPPGVAFDAAM